MSNPIEIPDEYKNIGSKLVNVNVNGNDIKIVRTWALSKYREQKVSASSAFIYDKNSSVQQQYNGSGQISISLKKGEKFFFTLLGAVCTGRDFIDPYNESDREPRPLRRFAPAHGQRQLDPGLVVVLAVTIISFRLFSEV